MTYCINALAELLLILIGTVQENFLVDCDPCSLVRLPGGYHLDFSSQVPKCLRVLLHY